jgi:hypothetical protein
VHRAHRGARGEPGDGLWTDEPGLPMLALSADCVPIAVAGKGRLVVLHAGWRGLLEGVVAAGVDAIGGGDAAVVGPAIGPCCYEVGEDVAGAVAAASAPTVLRRAATGRTHADLAAAAAVELARSGIDRIVHFDLCTRCAGDRLWSHRRDRESAGRNLAAVWLET